jgi:hypothetical protein
MTVTERWYDKHIISLGLKLVKACGYVFSLPTWWPPEVISLLRGPQKTQYEMEQQTCHSRDLASNENRGNYRYIDTSILLIAAAHITFRLFDKPAYFFTVLHLLHVASTKGANAVSNDTGRRPRAKSKVLETGRCHYFKSPSHHSPGHWAKARIISVTTVRNLAQLQTWYLEGT